MANYQKVFRVFENQPLDVPLEVFHNDPYKTLISTVLSSRTKDETTLAASKRLFKVASDIMRLSRLSNQEIKKLIFPVGFYKTKATQLQNLSRLLISDFNGKVPKTREELMSLPGVGRKTANLVLNRAFGIPAIAVDTHVHRISNLLGWVNTKTPEQTEKELMKVLPRVYWSRINHLFVSVGRQHNTHKKLTTFLRNHKLYSS